MPTANKYIAGIQLQPMEMNQDCGFSRGIRFPEKSLASDLSLSLLGARLFHFHVDGALFLSVKPYFHSR